ncbi:MAG: antibiotic biosynthesis monooxygenase family protein [Phycisphaerales bacterium]
MFTPLTDADPAAMTQAGLALESVLQEQPGFVGRTLARSSGNRWVDVVNWASTEDAKAAAGVVMSDPGLQSRTAPFFSLIDQGNGFDFSHSSILHRDVVRDVKMPEVIEVVLFRPAEGVDWALFVAKAEAAFTEIRELSGLISHQLSVDDSGRFIHVIVWASMEEAIAAPEQAMAMPAPSAWFGLMDPSSIDMGHYSIVR